MKCMECGADYVKRHGTLTEHDEYVGEWQVHDVDWLECPACGDVALRGDIAQRSAEARREKLDTLLADYPMKSFVLETEAAELLGVSKQAINQNRRIQRGFVYCLRRAGRNFYLKESLLQFKETGDGRFPLFEEEGATEAEVYGEGEFDLRNLEHKHYTSGVCGMHVSKLTVVRPPCREGGGVAFDFLSISEQQARYEPEEQPELQEG